jgi:hypothetical protein
MASAPAHTYHCHMDDDDPRPLRQQLTDAIANVRGQIDLQQRSRWTVIGSTGGDTIALQALQDELAQLEQALANLGAGG